MKNIFFVQQRQNQFKRMSVNTIRKSNEDNLIASTIAIHRDNENKLKIINNLQSF